MNGYQATLPSRKFSSNVLKAVTLAYLELVPKAENPMKMKAKSRFHND